MVTELTTPTPLPNIDQVDEVCPELNFIHPLYIPGGSDGKIVCLKCWRSGFNPRVRKIPWRRKRQPTPVLLPGKFHGWRDLVGYSPWDHTELGRTERLCSHFHCTSSIMIFSLLSLVEQVQLPAQLHLHHVQVMIHLEIPLLARLPTQPSSPGESSEAPLLWATPRSQPLPNRYRACFCAVVGCTLLGVAWTQKLNCIPWPPSGIIPDWFNQDSELRVSEIQLQSALKGVHETWWTCHSESLIVGWLQV